MTNIKVGDFVYRTYTPGSPAKVLEVKDVWEQLQAFEDGLPCSMKRQLVTVKFLDGQIATYETWDLHSFDALIADHRKKLSFHEANLEKLKKL